MREERSNYMSNNLKDYYFNPSEATPGMSIRDLNQFQYMEIAYATPLDKMAKYLLGYFAFRYNFVEHRGCKAGVRRIERDLGLSKNTITKWKKYLEDLGWITVKHRPRGETDIVFVRVGDPDKRIKVKNNYSEYYVDPLLDQEALGVEPSSVEFTEKPGELIPELEVIDGRGVSFEDFMESIAEDEWV